MAIREIERLGGVVSTQPKSPAWWRNWAGKERGTLFEDVDVVNLLSKQATDVTLGHVCRLTRVRMLNLTHTQVTDAGLAHLKGLTSLERLWLNDTQVTDAGMRHLLGLTRLQDLELADTKITDAGVAKLKHALPEVIIAK